MEDVGLVGVDQASWDATDTSTAALYLEAPFMKEGTATKPHVRARASRAYMGHPLELTAIAPQTSFPITVPAGSCYTVGLHSPTLEPMPYDGHLETDGTTPPTLWTSAQGGEPLWATNGIVTECLPEDFPPGEYKVRLRPHITHTPSDNETSLSYDEMPWSNNELWIVVE